VQRWIGIDLGGTKVEGVVVGKGGEVFFRHRLPTERERGYEHVLQRVREIYERCVEVAGVPPLVGIGTPGSESSRSGTMKNCNTTCLNGQPLRRDLEQMLRVPVVLENDANLFTWTEARFGAGQGARLVFGVILGTGVGGGIVWDGQIWRGAQHVAGEWGHHRLRDAGPVCYCGQRGCVETFLCGPAFERRAAELRGRIAPAAAVVAAARAGEEAAQRALQEYLDTFGRAFANVVNILDPDCIVLGGGLSNIDELYTGGREALCRYVFNDACSTRLVRHALGDSAGGIGAALLAAQTAESKSHE
jgi:fructokinase